MQGIKDCSINNIIPEYKIKVDESKWKIKWQKKYEKSLLLFITGKCNLNCENCFSISSRDSQEMTLEQIRKILDANTEFNKIDLMGGEPLLHKQISEIIKEIKLRNKQPSIYTNGIKLDKIKSDDMPIRACVSFHEIEAKNPSRKPLKPIMNNLEKFVNKGNKLKLVFLMDKYNIERALEIVNYVDNNMPFVSKLTIGLMRYENDYWNDNYEGVLPFEEYAKKVQEILDIYDGRLSLDIFLKGVLSFENDPGNLPNRVNRFKCVFQDLTYSDCLYTACDLKHPKLEDTYKVPDSFCKCKHTGKEKCLADKVRLTRLN